MKDVKNLSIDLTIACGIYISWFILVIFGNDLPIVLLFLAGGYLICLHGSLQHIAVHGYPTQWRWLNTVIVYPPLAFFYPYSIYRESHIQHHQIEILTDVNTDPESLYLSKSHWDRLNALSKNVYRFNFTLLGRLLIGPFVALYQLWKGQALLIFSGDLRCALTWIGHIAACLVIALFVHYASDMPIWKYLLCFVYPGISFTLLRSYTEHRWSDNENERSIIVEGSRLSRLLYLNNNYHWVHHENPALPWQELSTAFRQRRSEILQSNRNFYYKGYFQLFARLFKDRWVDPIHPSQSS